MISRLFVFNFLFGTFQQYFAFPFSVFDDFYFILFALGNDGFLQPRQPFPAIVYLPAAFLDLLGLQTSLPALRLILPVGISFYTFQTLSYTIDVYRRELRATRNLLDLALFVGFFPQLVAGPIVRARAFLPQLQLLIQRGKNPADSQDSSNSCARPVNRLTDFLPGSPFAL